MGGAGQSGEVQERAHVSAFPACSGRSSPHRGFGPGGTIYKLTFLGLVFGWFAENREMRLYLSACHRANPSIARAVASAETPRHTFPKHLRRN